MKKELILKYMVEAVRVAERSDCLSRKVGAVIGSPDGFYIYATGWNASPLSFLEKGCSHKKKCQKRDYGFASGQGHEFCRAIHAEVRALMEALTKESYFTNDKAMFVTHLPCANCAKMIIDCDITDVYYLEPYPDKASVQLFAEYDVALHNVSDMING